MDAEPQRPKGQDTTLSTLNLAIDALNFSKDVSGIEPAKIAFGTVSVLLTMIKDSMINEQEYVGLGLFCADICKALDRGVNGKELGDLSQSVRDAINQLTTTVAEIQRKVIKQSGRNAVSRLFHAKNDKEKIASWRSELNRILHVFNTELGMNNLVTVIDIRNDVSKIREEIRGQVLSTQPSILGESPPPPPRTCFGRDELIEKMVGLAENLAPIALVGAGGIGKTAIALTVLHHDHIKERFGDNRRFIRCDQFLAARTHFLSKLSKVVGAGIENPRDLTSLRPFLSSREIILFLDNAESILDPRGPDSQEIYAVVEELSQLKTICLCITSRISTVPPNCNRPTIPTLSMDSACDIFYGIYKTGIRSSVISNILEQLDFHALSITLLATVASHNMWDYGRLAREWDIYRTQALCTDYNQSLAATIELSLASPMFHKLGPNAHDLLGVIAFYPQGISENNLDWLFPTLSNTKTIIDKFCVLSLTYRSNGFITMLAPLRDYFSPKDPRLSPLLCQTRECYFHWLQVYINPGEPGFNESKWIVSEDVNVEHLLNVFTSIEKNSASVWDACSSFMNHLYWHKKRLVVLGPKIKGLPDGHHSKPLCLFWLSQLFDAVGNYAEEKQLLIYALKLHREQGDIYKVADTLRALSNVNSQLGLLKEGISQAKEALEIYKQLNLIPWQGDCLYYLASLLYEDNQLNAAEEAASHAVDLSGNGEQFIVCKCHHILGKIYYSKGKTVEAANHFKTALGIAFPFSWHYQLSLNHYTLAELFSNEGRFNDAHVHIEQAKLYAIDNNNTFTLGCVMELQAQILYKEYKLQEAKAEALSAANVFERLGAMDKVESCSIILQKIEEEKKKLVTSAHGTD